MTERPGAHDRGSASAKIWIPDFDKIETNDFILVSDKTTLKDHVSSLFTTLHNNSCSLPCIVWVLNIFNLIHNRFRQFTCFMQMPMFFVPRPLQAVYRETPVAVAVYAFSIQCMFFILVSLVQKSIKSFKKESVGFGLQKNHYVYYLWIMTLQLGVWLCVRVCGFTTEANLNWHPVQQQQQQQQKQQPTSTTRYLDK